MSSKAHMTALKACALGGAFAALVDLALALAKGGAPTTGAALLLALAAASLFAVLGGAFGLFADLALFALGNERRGAVWAAFRDAPRGALARAFTTTAAGITASTALGGFLAAEALQTVAESFWILYREGGTVLLWPKKLALPASHRGKHGEPGGDCLEVGEASRFAPC